MIRPMSPSMRPGNRRSERSPRVRAHLVRPPITFCLAVVMLRRHAGHLVPVPACGWTATAAALPGRSGSSGAGTSGHEAPPGGSGTTPPASREVEEGVTAAHGRHRHRPAGTAWHTVQRGEVRPGQGQALSDPAAVVPDQRVTLAAFEAGPLGAPPCRVPLQVRQRLKVRAPADPVHRQVVLPPLQRCPCPAVQAGDRQRRPVHRAGRGKRRKDDPGIAGGRPDSGKGSPPHCG